MIWVRAAAGLFRSRSRCAASNVRASPLGDPGVAGEAGQQRGRDLAGHAGAVVELERRAAASGCSGAARGRRVGTWTGKWSSLPLRNDVQVPLRAVALEVAGVGGHDLGDAQFGASGRVFPKVATAGDGGSVGQLVAVEALRRRLPRHPRPSDVLGEVGRDDVGGVCCRAGSSSTPRSCARDGGRRHLRLPRYRPTCSVWGHRR